MAMAWLAMEGETAQGASEPGIKVYDKHFASLHFLRVMWFLLLLLFLCFSATKCGQHLQFTAFFYATLLLLRPRRRQDINQCLTTTLRMARTTTTSEVAGGRGVGTCGANKINGNFM